MQLNAPNNKTQIRDIQLNLQYWIDPMKLRTAFAVITLTISTNCNAGFFDDLVNSGKDKIDQFETSVKESDTSKAVSSALSNEDIVAGLKQALTKGASYAVDHLGKADGFLKNTAVKIPMPDKLSKVESILRKAGKEKYADEFVITINRAAESAVPLTLDIIKQGVADMSIADAKTILTGPDDAATQYLKKTGSDKLKSKILPIVKQATAKAGVTKVYKTMYSKLGFAGKYIDLEDYNVDNYVTNKTMKGLFLMIADEEKKIRDNPAARTTDILKNVFGSN